MPGLTFSRSATAGLTILACLFLATFCTASEHSKDGNYKDWDYEETHSDVRDFIAGGMLHLRLSVGDIRITRGDSNQIRLRYTVKSDREKKMKESQVEFEVHGRDAEIDLHSPAIGNTQFDVELEVPRITNLDVHDKVGDLTIKDIEGDKDLQLGVGDIRIEVERSAYHLVNASTSIGDVNGNGYGETEGWLGKTLKYHGDGKYELRAHVGVGDISLEEK